MTNEGSVKIVDFFAIGAWGFVLGRWCISHYYTPVSEVPGEGVYCNHCLSVCLSVRLSLQILVRPISFFCFDIGLPYLAHGCITMRWCLAFIHDLDKVKFIGFCHVFMFKLKLCFDIGITYLADGSITLKGCVTHIHDPDTTMTFDLKLKLIWFMTCLCVQASAFLSFDIVILCFARECITMVRCVVYIHELFITMAFDLNIKIILSPWIWVWHWHRHTKFWHMHVSPWYKNLCTFLSWVWPWPLTYMWVSRVSLVSFTYSFYLVIKMNMHYFLLYQYSSLDCYCIGGI